MERVFKRFLNYAKEIVTLRHNVQTVDDLGKATDDWKVIEGVPVLVTELSPFEKALLPVGVEEKDNLIASFLPDQEVSTDDIVIFSDGTEYKVMNPIKRRFRGKITYIETRLRRSSP